MNAKESQTFSLNRIESVDALRATALLGILIMHCSNGFTAGHEGTVFPDWVNQIFHFFIYEVLALKSFMVFIFLFGLSFFFQMDRAEKRGIDFRNRFCVRLFWLFVFGLIHVSFYSQDVLTLFAILGFALVLMWKVPVKYTLFLCIICLLQPIKIYEMVIQNPTWMQDFVANHLSFSPLFPAEDSSWLSLAINNLSGCYVTRWLSWELPSGRLFATIGMFFLGMIFGKFRIFEKDRHTILKFSFIGLCITIVIALIGLVSFCCIWGIGDIKQMIVSRSDEVLGKNFLYYFIWLVNEASLLFFAPFFVWLYSLPQLQKIIKPLKAIGRCTLTCYITQGVVMTFFFYKWGLAMASKCDLASCVLAGLCLYAIQMVFCYYWLKRFKYGPLEGVWRYLTHLGSK